jgi:hypothetical protein
MSAVYLSVTTGVPTIEIGGSAQNVRGATSLTNAGRIPEVTATGTLGESQLADAISGGVLSVTATLTDARALTLPDQDVELTAFGASLIDDENQAAARSTLGLVIGTDVQAHDADLDAVAALTGTGYAERTGADTWSLAATIPWADISSTPTTLAGYGIPNAEIETAYNARVAAASQGEMEAGTETGIRRMSPLRVAQAIASQAAAKLTNNFSATAAPTVDDDSGDDYAVGSLWIDTTNDETYRCADPTAGAAVWVKTSLTSDELAAVALSGGYDDLTGKPTLGTLAALDTVSDDDWSGADLAVANGGTGASDASTARSNLGLEIGTDVQAYDADLSAIAALSSADGNFIVGSASGWVAESGNTARTSLGLGTGDSPTFAGLSVTGDITGGTSGTDFDITHADNNSRLRVVGGPVAGTDASIYVTGSTFATSAAVLINAAETRIRSANGGTTFATFDSSSLTLGSGIDLNVSDNDLINVGDAIFSGDARANITTESSLNYETGQDAFGSFTNGIFGWMRRTLFSAYADVTQTAAVTSQSLRSATAKGTATLPANWWKQGKRLHYRLSGVHTTDASPGNVTVTIKLGSTTFRTTGSFAPTASASDAFWRLEGEIVCQSTGATGSVQGCGAFEHVDSAGTNSPLDAQSFTSASAVTIDTTASMDFDVEWTADDSGTSITCTEFTLEEVG